MTKIVKSAFLGVCLAAMLQACDGTEVNHGTDGAVMPDGDVMMVDGGMDGGSVDGGNGCGFTGVFTQDPNYSSKTNVINGIMFEKQINNMDGITPCTYCNISVINDGSVHDYKMVSVSIADSDPDVGIGYNYLLVGNPGPNTWNYVSNAHFPNGETLTTDNLLLAGNVTRILFKTEVNGWNPFDQNSIATFTATFTCVP